MGNCSATQHADGLRLVTACVQVLRLDAGDETQKKKADGRSPEPHTSADSSLESQTSTTTTTSWTEMIQGATFRKREVKVHAGVPSSRSHSWPALISPVSGMTSEVAKRSVSSTNLSYEAGRTCSTSTTTTAPAEQKTVEIIFTKALPHSRFCKRLKMRRTCDFARVVAPMVAPGSRLRITYDPTTLMIHVLEPAADTSPSTIVGSCERISSGVTATLRHSRDSKPHPKRNEAR